MRYFDNFRDNFMTNFDMLIQVNTCDQQIVQKQLEKQKNNGQGRYSYFQLPFDDTELAIIGVVVSCVVRCPTVVVIVAAVEVGDSSVALVLYVKFAKVLCHSLQELKLQLYGEFRKTYQNERNQVQF